MKIFRTHTGVAAPVLQININTDILIPSREIKSVSKTGLGDGLFADWRYLHKGTKRIGPNPDFILNHPGYETTSIILAGDNFGCGSSREYAVWALVDFGIRAIIAPGFGSIFFNNCIRNGLLPLVLEQTIVAELARSVLSDPSNNMIEIDLETCRVTASDGTGYEFQTDPQDREMLLNGLNQIDITLQRVNEINTFKARGRRHRPWAALDQAPE